MSKSLKRLTSSQVQEDETATEDKQDTKKIIELSQYPNCMSFL